MNQQINLYQPIFRQERKLFSLRTVGIALGIIAIVLLGIWGFGAHNVASLARDVSAVRKQLQTQQQMAEKAGGALSASTSSEAVQANIKILSAQLADRTRALGLLRSGAAGSTDGFAARLAALARCHTDGLWLERMLLGPNGVADASAAGSALWLEGRSLDAQLVPLYLQQLANEPALSGTRFDEVVIDRLRNREAAERAAQIKAPIAARTRDDEQTESVRFSITSRSLRESQSESQAGPHS